MKNQLIVGVVLALLGAGMLAYQSFTYTTKEEVLKIGPLSATAETEHRVGFPPIISWAILAAGLGLIVVGSRRK